MELKLLVVRTVDQKRLIDFYSQLGFVFEYHKHGNSPYHYSAKMGSGILEIYPLTKSQTEADKNLRLGFSLDKFDLVIQELKDKHFTFISEPSESDFGFMAIVEDPDGRKVELYKNEF
jgi:lactoylglutathione lyase